MPKIAKNQTSSLCSGSFVFHDLGCQKWSKRVQNWSQMVSKLCLWEPKVDQKWTKVEPRARNGKTYIKNTPKCGPGAFWRDFGLHFGGKHVLKMKQTITKQVSEQKRHSKKMPPGSILDYLWELFGNRLGAKSDPRTTAGRFSKNVIARKHCKTRMG